MTSAVSASSTAAPVDMHGWLAMAGPGEDDDVTPIGDPDDGDGGSEDDDEEDDDEGDTLWACGATAAFR